MIKKILAIACILIVIGAIGGLLTFRQFHQTVSISKEKLFNGNDITAIQLDSHDTKVDIIPVQSNKLKVELKGQTTKDMQRTISTTVKNGKLFIGVKETAPKFFNLHFVVLKDLHLKLYIPEKQYNALKIESDNGKVEAKGLNIKNVSANTNNGEIHLTDISSSDVRVHSDNGQLVLDRVTGRLTGSTNNGKIYMITEHLNRDIQLRSDNGEIEIETDKEPTNARFHVHSDNGSINILDKYKDDATIGKGQHLIQLSTDNGAINVENIKKSK